MSLFAAMIATLVGIQTPTSVPFKIGDDAIIVDAFVNNRKVSLMFDTGFSGDVVLNDSINIGPSSGELNLRDFVGTFTARTVKLNTLKLGELLINKPGLEAVQQPMAHLSYSYNTHTDGILGFGPFSNQTLEINFEKSVFRFHPRSLDITQRKPDNQRTFLARMLPIGHNSIEMEVKTSAGKRMILALDTGNAFFATTHRDVLERVGLWTKGIEPKYVKSSYVASGPVDSWYKRMSGIDIYGIPVPLSYWDIIDLPSSSAEGDGTIGFGFLKNFNITIDYERRRVWLENFTGKFANEPAGGLGFSVRMDAAGQRGQIVRIAPEGPADKAGLKRGDQLLSIDGHELTGLSDRQLDHLLEGAVGSSIKLAVSSGGALSRHTLERVALVND